MTRNPWHKDSTERSISGWALGLFSRALSSWFSAITTITISSGCLASCVCHLSSVSLCWACPSFRLHWLSISCETGVASNPSVYSLRCAVAGHASRKHINHINIYESFPLWQIVQGEFNMLARYVKIGRLDSRPEDSVSTKGVTVVITKGIISISTAGKGHRTFGH